MVRKNIIVFVLLKLSIVNAAGTNASLSATKANANIEKTSTDKLEYENVGEISLKKICSNEESYLNNMPGLLTNYLVEANLALLSHKSGKVVLFDLASCKNLVTYERGDFSKYRFTKKFSTQIQGNVQSKSGDIIPFKNPQNFTRDKDELSLISNDGNFILWQAYNKFVLKSLSSGNESTILFPLKDLKNSPEIIEYDVDEGWMLGIENRTAYVVFDFNGNILERLPTDVKPFSHAPNIRIFRTEDNKWSWVVWENGSPILKRITTIQWNTKYGSGKLTHLDDSGRVPNLESVSITPDARLIAVTYGTYNKNGQGKIAEKDFMLKIIDTKTGKSIFSKLVGSGKQFGSTTNESQFLGNKNIVINRFTQSDIKGVQVVNNSGIEVFEIVPGLGTSFRSARKKNILNYKIPPTIKF